MRILSLAAVCTALQLLVSCQMLQSPSEATKTANNPPPTPNSLSTDYYPLAVGNEWHFVPDSTICFFVPYSGHIVRVVGERTVGTTTEFDMTDSILDIERRVNRYVLVKEGNKVWKTSTSDNGTIEWLIDFDATVATQDKDYYGFVQEKLDNHTVIAGTFKNAARIFFPAAAYDGMPVTLFAQGIGPIRYINFGVPTELRRAVIDGKIYGK